MTDPWAPGCMDADELAEYRAGTVGGCRDCTETYADEMRAEGRCNGVPGELLAGVVADEEETPAPRRVRLPVIPIPKETRVTVQTAPPQIPCGSCLHERVCALKASIPAESGEPVAITAGFAEGLRMFVTGYRIECDHYLPPTLALVAPRGRVDAVKQRKGRARGDVKAERAAAVLTALARHGGDRRAAAEELGMRPNVFAMVLKYASVRMPAAAAS